VAVVVFILLMNLFSQEFTYVGAAKCKTCHKSDKRGRQFPIWEESKHSKSFMALTSEEVKAEVPDAPENPKCLKCHSPLFEKGPEFKEEGVICEVCHGPGSAYKKLSIMKNREESVKNGLIVYDSPEAIKTQCLTCHEMAHEKSFDFDASWAKIKHPVPEKK
jgi:excinuclease UvrABC ATPase subunit